MSVHLNSILLKNTYGDRESIMYYQITIQTFNHLGIGFLNIIERDSSWVSKSIYFGPRINVMEYRLIYIEIKKFIC